MQQEHGVRFKPRPAAGRSTALCRIDHITWTPPLCCLCSNVYSLIYRKEYLTKPLTAASFFFFFTFSLHFQEFTEYLLFYQILDQSLADHGQSQNQKHVVLTTNFLIIDEKNKQLEMTLPQVFLWGCDLNPSIRYFLYSGSLHKSQSNFWSPLMEPWKSLVPNSVVHSHTSSHF